MEIRYYKDKISENEKSIVLCGPTPRESTTISWRPEALKILKKLEYDGIVYVPEYENEKEYDSDFEKIKYNWERNTYINSTVIIFWVPRKIPNMLGLTTNVEFGYWLKSGKCIYGRPDYAQRTRYLDWLYNLEYKKEPHNKLEELLKEAIILANEKGIV